MNPVRRLRGQVLEESPVEEGPPTEEPLVDEMEPLEEAPELVPVEEGPMAEELEQFPNREVEE